MKNDLAIFYWNRPDIGAVSLDEHIILVNGHEFRLIVVFVILTIVCMVFN